MNRRTFGLRTLATIAGIAGLTFAQVSLTEAASFPDDLCVGLEGREREQCVARECRRESGGPLTGTPRMWEVWGYKNVKACINENS